MSGGQCWPNRGPSPAAKGATMSDVVEKPALNGVNTPTLLATINTVGAQPELAAFQFRARASWVSGTHSRIVVDDFFGAGQEMRHEVGDRDRCRPPGRPRRRRQRPHAGRVPAAGPRGLHDGGDRQHRRGARRQARIGRVGGRGRHQPARAPRPRSGGAQRLFRHPCAASESAATRPPRSSPRSWSRAGPFRRLRRADERCPVAIEIDAG